VRLVIALLLLSAPLRAQPDSTDERRARALFQSGERMYEEGRYEEAVENFREAYRLSPRPSLLYDIANADERLGRLGEAARALKQYLESAPADEQPLIERRVASLERRAARVEPPLVAPAPVVSVEKRPWRFRMTRRGSAFLALTLVGLAAGAVAGGLALQYRHDAAGDCQSAGGATYCSSAARGDVTRRFDSAVTSDVSFGVAALSGALFLICDFPWKRGP
jgi:tetratricopeptide (TPR) repeat protein